MLKAYLSVKCIICFNVGLCYIPFGLGILDHEKKIKVNSGTVKSKEEIK